LCGERDLHDPTDATARPASFLGGRVDPSQRPRVLDRLFKLRRRPWSVGLHEDLDPALLPAAATGADAYLRSGRTHYQERGEGLPVVLLHGSGRSHGDWLAVATTASTARAGTRATVVRGAVGGVIAGAVMAMFASVTCQHHGFFTPLFPISALFGSLDATMRSVEEATVGHRFWFDAGPAALGLAIHMAIGAMFGVGFVLLTRRLRVPANVLTGAGYGLVVFVVSAFVGLPIAATVTGSGSTISDMASMVDWVTFAVEHMVFGAVLGVLVQLTASRGAGVADVAGSAKLSR
jgi:hypothetical protein